MNALLRTILIDTLKSRPAVPVYSSSGRQVTPDMRREVEGANAENRASTIRAAVKHTRSLFLLFNLIRTRLTLPPYLPMPQSPPRGPLIWPWEALIPHWQRPPYWYEGDIRYHPCECVVKNHCGGYGCGVLHCVWCRDADNHGEFARLRELHAEEKRDPRAVEEYRRLRTLCGM